MRLPKPRASVIIQRDSAEVFMIDEERGEVFQVNDSAARIFEFCREQLTVDQAVSALLSELIGPEQQVDQHDDVQADVQAVAEQLQMLGLCETSSREAL